MFPVEWHSLPVMKNSNTRIQTPEITKSAHSIPWSKPTLKSDLKQMQSLDECFQFLKEMAEETKAIRKISYLRKKGTMENDTAEQKNPTVQQRIIFSWAERLDSIRKNVKTVPHNEQKAHITKEEDAPDILKDNNKIMMWAKELKTVSESLGMTDDDMKQILGSYRVNQTSLSQIKPFLEFMVWSLLSHDSEEDVVKMWLSTKQMKWKTGNQKYIPNSVWQWIQSASVDVQLDSVSCHHWLCVSEDKRELRERHIAQPHQDSQEQFDCRSFVLGLNGFSSGRHYWEVQVPTDGSWGLGVTAASSARKGRFDMDPEGGYWCIYKGSKNLWACTQPRTKLLFSVLPQVVGVYVDYLEGQVSFYDAMTRFHIYTFTQTFKDILFPVFALLDGNIVLKIQIPQTLHYM